MIDGSVMPFNYSTSTVRYCLRGAPECDSVVQNYCSFLDSESTCQTKNVVQLGKIYATVVPN